MSPSSPLAWILLLMLVWIIGGAFNGTLKLLAIGGFYLDRKLAKPKFGRVIQISLGFLLGAFYGLFVALLHRLCQVEIKSIPSSIVLFIFATGALTFIADTDKDAKDLTLDRPFAKPAREFFHRTALFAQFTACFVFAMSSILLLSLKF
jgi:hypothetical protein